MNDKEDTESYLREQIHAQQCEIKALRTALMYNSEKKPPAGISEEDLVWRLHRRAEIRRQIPSRKSVQNGEPDRIADLLEEAADEIATLRMDNKRLKGFCWETEEAQEFLAEVRKSNLSEFLKKVTEK